MTAEPTTHSAPAYPFSTAVRLDLDPKYAELRRSEPMTRVTLPYGGEAWLATGYAEVKQALADPRFSMEASTAPDTPRVTPQPLRPGGLLAMDAPEHTRLRRLVAKAFTGRRVEALRPRAKEIVADLLDKLEAHGQPADLVEHFALPLPVTVICEMLGVPAGQQHRFRDFSDAVLSTTAYTSEQIDQARIGLEDYLAELVELRRREPGDDLLSALIEARDNDDRLSEQEMIMLGVGVLVAGHETTANQIANFTYLLLSEPDRLAELRADPSLVPAAVEELLRFTPLGSGGSFARIATEDIEMGGVTVRAGEAVVVAAAPANRDEQLFPKPDQLDFGRPTNPHIAFGHGVHHCLGAQLARMELQEALEALVRRFPGLRFAVPDDQLPWKSGLLVRGPKALPIAW